MSASVAPHSRAGGAAGTRGDGASGTRAQAAYWEVVVEAAGPFRVGVCKASADLDAQLETVEVGAARTSWALDAGDAEAAEGDVIGVAFGQADMPNLRFFKNGQPLDRGQVGRVRGTVYPAASVAGGAKLRLVFDEAVFAHEPPRLGE